MGLDGGGGERTGFAAANADVAAGVGIVVCVRIIIVLEGVVYLSFARWVGVDGYRVGHFDGYADFVAAYWGCGVDAHFEVCVLCFCEHDYLWLCAVFQYFLNYGIVKIGRTGDDCIVILCMIPCDAKRQMDSPGQLMT